jgi:hypothetical protein
MLLTIAPATTYGVLRMLRLCHNCAGPSRQSVAQRVPAMTVLHSALSKIESSELRLGKDFTWVKRKKSKVERVNFSRAPSVLFLALLLGQRTASPPKYKIQKRNPVRLWCVTSAKIPT